MTHPITAIVAGFPDLEPDAAELLASLLHEVDRQWRAAMVHALNATGGNTTLAIVRGVWASICPIELHD